MSACPTSALPQRGRRFFGTKLCISGRSSEEKRCGSVISGAKTRLLRGSLPTRDTSSGPERLNCRWSVSPCATQGSKAVMRVGPWKGLRNNGSRHFLSGSGKPISLPASETVAVHTGGLREARLGLKLGAPRTSCPTDENAASQRTSRRFSNRRRKKWE
jgi:hypothetical protein